MFFAGLLRFLLCVMEEDEEDDVDADISPILDNLNHDSLLANMTRVVLAVTMCLTFPLDFFVVRYTVQRFFQRCCRASAATIVRYINIEPYQVMNVWWL